MTEPFLPEIEPVRYAGADCENPLAYRFYDAERSVLGRPMREQLRIAVCYWHSFSWPGSDVFGAGTFGRPWLVEGGDAMAQARRRLEVAFEFAFRDGVEDVIGEFLAGRAVGRTRQQPRRDRVEQVADASDRHTKN